MKLEFHDAKDWCHFCGLRNKPFLLDVIYDNGRDYIRICSDCIFELFTFVRSGLSTTLFLSTVYERIKYAREKAGFNQKSFAAELNISPCNWSKIENGTLRVHYDLLENINKLLGLDVRYYFGLLNYEEARYMGLNR